MNTETFETFKLAPAQARALAGAGWPQVEESGQRVILLPPRVYTEEELRAKREAAAAAEAQKQAGLRARKAQRQARRAQADRKPRGQR